MFGLETKRSWLQPSDCSALWHSLITQLTQKYKVLATQTKTFVVREIYPSRKWRILWMENMRGERTFSRKGQMGKNHQEVSSETHARAVENRSLRGEKERKKSCNWTFSLIRSITDSQKPPTKAHHFVSCCYRRMLPEPSDKKTKKTPRIIPSSLVTRRA